MGNIHILNFQNNDMSSPSFPPISMVLLKNKKDYLYDSPQIHIVVLSEPYHRYSPTVKMYNQLLVAISVCFRTLNQAGLPAYRLSHPPPSRFPSGYRLRSLITVTSSYRICTCFPFHQNGLI